MITVYCYQHFETDFADVDDADDMGRRLERMRRALDTEAAKSGQSVNSATVTLEVEALVDIDVDIRKPGDMRVSLWGRAQ